VRRKEKRKNKVGKESKKEPENHTHLREKREESRRLRYSVIQICGVRGWDRRDRVVEAKK